MSSESLGELEELELGPSSELLNMIPSSSLNRTQKLKKCTVRACELLELAFDIDEDNYQNEELLPRLEELVLIDLPRVERFWRQEPTIPVFKNLVFLELVRCSNLKTLFSISIAKNLEQLELLKLYDCEKMEHVLWGEARSGNVMEFKKLKRIILKCLPKLASFCEGCCDFKFPELEIVRVKDIPKMQIFAKGIHQTPKLKEFYITYVSNCWQGDLNKTIEYLRKYPGGEEAGILIVKDTLTCDDPTKKSGKPAEPSIEATNSEELYSGGEDVGHKMVEDTAEEPSNEAKNTGAVAKDKQKIVE